MDKISVPHSRLRRELNKWMRFLRDNPEVVVHITCNKKDVAVLMPPELYEDMIESIKVSVDEEL